MEEPHWLKAHYDKLNYQITATTQHHRAVIVTTTARLNRRGAANWRERLFK